MKKKTKMFLVIALLVIALISFLFLEKSSKGNTSSEKEYRVIKVNRINPFAVTGRINSDRVQRVKIPSGKIQEIDVKNGDKVTNGQQLVIVYSQTKQETANNFKQEIVKQQREVSSAEKKVNALKNNQVKNADGMNSTDLQEQISEAQSDYDDASYSLGSLQDKMQKTQAQIYDSVTAPFSGIVQIDYDLDGNPSFKIYSDELEFVADVSEYDYNKIKNNSSLKITALASKESVTTNINFISKEPSKGSKENEAKYEFTAPLHGDFMTGQTARASIDQKGLSIPTSSIKKNGVYIVNKKNRVSFHRISGENENGYYKVSAGLQFKQKVIANPDSKLHSGDKVKIND
ncbi:efflux RND transporter periplasmic adaptor subunit [Lactiplantibacillus paraplantarum]|uniref:efflux RND transporter periplasmic adaptor subunit n=1 Tax=Lactiplantibacillus paraplantarum TaxID=60520 RepID=UPI003B28519A